MAINLVSLLESVMMAGIAVTAAEPSGLVPVSEGEKATLTEISSALRLAAWIRSS